VFNATSALLASQKPRPFLTHPCFKTLISIFN
jgi:hypothetical protein